MKLAMHRKPTPKGETGKLRSALTLVSAVFVALGTSAGLPTQRAAAQDDARPAEETNYDQIRGGGQSADAQAAADLELISALERVVQRAIARAERSVVSLARRRRPPATSPSDWHFGRPSPDTGNPWDPNFVPNEFATGVVIDANGLVLTNNHVLGDEPANQEFFVRTIGRKQFEMKVKASDATSDLAVLELVHPDLRRSGDFVPIEFGDAALLKKGQIVIALGNPYAIARDGQVSASWGIVANLSRKAASPVEDETHKTLHDYGTLIQTDARLNLGTSGGALVNLRGEMVGLTTSLAATSGFEQAAGYAIPIDKPFQRIIQTLKEGREVEYGLLGININHAGPSPDQHVQGVVVGSAIPGGPAWKAKLQPRDIITHVDGKPIYDFDGLRVHVSRLPPETIVTLTVRRPDQNATLKRRTMLSKYPVELPQTFTTRPASWRGATIDYRRPGRRDVAVLSPAAEDLSTPCVAVREIEEGSLAWTSGLRQGMLISQVGSTAVETPGEFRKAVASQTGPITLQLVAADGSKHTLTVPAE
ncbi:MAG TPA: trypsin-like peptidase domain-containing protein [Pirellulales bacterium]|nr:trypsin-like peptidase domain-containing protein [Pirellulales bacterium]